jgi:molybdate transport repressor ModE-like protein
MTLRISFEPELRVGLAGNEDVAALPLPLLHAIRQSGSIAEAARAIGCSYRHAWGLIGKWKDVFGQPLANLEPGRGTQLTPLGERLLWADQQVRDRVGPVLAELAAELEVELSKGSRAKRRRPASRQ